jgi:hypothetical protein
MKIKLPFHHPARDMIISDIYEEVEKKNIKPENWKVFIKNKFNNAKSYIN